MIDCVALMHDTLGSLLSLRKLGTEMRMYAVGSMRQSNHMFIAESHQFQHSRIRLACVIWQGWWHIEPGAQLFAVSKCSVTHSCACALSAQPTSQPASQVYTETMQGTERVHLELLREQDQEGH